MNTTESINSGVAAPEIDEIRSEIDDDERENEDIDNEFGELNSQDGEEDDEEAELSPKLAEGFYEIETVRRKRVRKGQVQYLIKWRGWPETANTWEPYENLVSCFDVIEAFEEGIGVDVLESNTSETICFEKGHQKVNGEGLVQANGRLRNRRKATSVKRFSQEQTPRVTYYAATGQGNGNESIDIPLQVEGKDHYEMDVNPGGYAGTPVINGDSSRMAADILESRTSEAFFFENGHQKVDGEGLVQANGRLRNRRKAASVKRFNQEQTPCVTNYAAQDLTTKNTRAGGIAGQNWDKNSVHRSTSDNSADTFSITEIIKPISFSSSGSIADILVTFMAKRSDGKEVMVDNKYLKANYPLLLINYYEQHLNYNATAGPDRSGREYLTG
ncbi:hypothetical protein DCAR_0414983 [Daucus carota subsp. sativus]|uniref:Chromo domain-containing protein n=1 Tax=Daucus carota subsp. sativus TaxID=79200 RepID=A0AAF1AX20_DAUCS|nr:hypothetical protein DCAR_0414983 [Daucus carota subsp. sativus]